MTDACSLGLTLYETLTGRPAYDRRDPNHVLHQAATAGPTGRGAVTPTGPSR